MSIFSIPGRTRLEFDWEVETPTSIAYKLARLEVYIENRVPLYEEAKEVLQDDMAEKFETETAPDGTPWAPLVKPEPQQIGILRRGSTGAAMFHAAISETAWSIGAEGVEFNTGSLPPYWIFHEQPDQAASRIPQREFIAPSLNAEVELFALGERWLEMGVNRATATGVGPRRPSTGRFHHPVTKRFLPG